MYRLDSDRDRVFTVDIYKGKMVDSFSQQCHIDQTIQYRFYEMYTYW